MESDLCDVYDRDGRRVREGERRECPGCVTYMYEIVK